MHIDNPDALIHWLTGYLPPLCDADPVVLAKYCFALVKKDRPEDELKASLNEQLDVFLKSNTILFVDKLLEVARTKSYLPKDAPVPVKSNATSSDDKVESSDSVPAEAAAPEEAKSTANVTSSSPAPQSTEAPQPPLPAVPPPSQSVPHPPPEIAPPLPTAKSEPASDPTVKSKKPTNEREKDGERRHRKSVRTTDRSRTKSRSRSRERDRRRSRSRGRSGRNKFDDRRRRSPHAKRHGGYCRRSRSPRFSASPSRRSRSRDRRSRSWNKSASSPKRRGGARSRSPKNAASRKETSPVAKTSPAPQERNGSQSPENTESVSVQSVISVPGKLERYSVSSARSKRCRDYDEQGFCMKGDHCPFDHGSDPVVLEGGALDFPPPVPRVPPMTYRVPAPSLPQRAFTRPPPPRPNEFGEYTPNKPDLWTGDSIVASAPHFSSRGGRRIIAVPPPRFSAPPPPIGLGVSVNGTGGGLQKNYDRPSLAERLGQTMEQHPSGHVPITVPPPSHIPKFSGGPDNVTLELRKVPAGLNTITNLNQHFAKFGNIVNIQIHYNGDPEASLVTFSSHSEASAAYKSTEAVLNNRFIKLFWHNAARREVPSSTTNVQRGRDRMPVRNPNKSLNNRVPQINEVASSSSKDKVMLTKEGLKKTVFNATAAKPSPADDGSAEPPSDAAAEAEAARKQLTSVEIKKQEIETIRKQQELLKAEILARQKQEKAKTEALKLKTEVENRAKQLLKEQMQHVKLLITKLETNRATMKPEEVKLMLQTIKSLQAAIETTKAQLASSMAPPASAPAPAPTKPQPKKIKTQLEKEILDTEMELYSIKSDGMDLSQIKSRLVELKAKAGQLKAQKSYAQGLRRVLPNNRPLLRGVRGAVRGSRARGRAGRHYGSFGGHGSVAPAAAVDRRTTTIDASGFEREDKMEVLAHFTALGTISTFSWDDLTPAVTVQFATRKEAEKAMTDGRHLGDRLLTLTWVSNLSSKLTSPTSSGGPVVDVAAKPSRSRSSSFSTSPARSSQEVNASALVSQTDDEIEITEEIVEEIETEEIVDCFDEEEDGSEEGDRSWRR